MKQKIINCTKCCGMGHVGVFNRVRCDVCEGRGWVTAPMTNADWIRDMTDEEMAVLLMEIARDPKWNDDGHMYELWCDNCGGCQEMNEEELEREGGCSDEMQIVCILRYLQAPALEGHVHGNME